MARTDRLFTLIQDLRGRRQPVTASALAAELGVSKRTVHRDLDTLRALGAPVSGESGVGYVLRPGFLLPPLMLTEDERDALLLGARWVRQRGDPALAAAADSALTKIGTVMPEGLAAPLDAPFLVTAAGHEAPKDGAEVTRLRATIRDRRKITVNYTSLAGDSSERVLWPIALAYFDNVRLLAAWCENRAAFRHFRVDRLRILSMSDERYPGSRIRLLKAWREQDPMRGLRC